jgi:hypothetical protein
MEACQSSLIEALGVGLGLQTGRPRRAGGHVPDHPPALLHRHRQPSRSLLSWTARVDGTRTMCRVPGNVPPAVDHCDGSCSHRFSFEFVRSNVGAGGLTLTIVRGPVKSTVRSASEGIYRPIRPLRRIRWCLKRASWSSRTSGHWRASSSRACGPKGRPSPSATTVRAARPPVDRRLRARAARPALPGNTGLDMLGAIRADAGTGQ